MPIYEYQCNACGKVNEVWAKMSDPAPEACDTCHKGPLTKLMSSTSFILNGSGWYASNAPKPSCPAKSDSASEAPASCPAVSGGHGGGCGCCH
jgi:putative FmdB family regulatory protein